MQTYGASGNRWVHPQGRRGESIPNMETRVVHRSMLGGTCEVRGALVPHVLVCVALRIGGLALLGQASGQTRAQPGCSLLIEVSAGRSIHGRLRPGAEG